MKAAWLLMAVTAAAQTADQTGSVSGVVTDAVTHIPIKKAMVSINPLSSTPQRQPPAATMTDASGAFTIPNLQAGQYRLVVQHQNYPQARFGGVAKNVEVKAGETAGPVNVELIPGATVSGRVIDEDGDPLQNCYVQIHPAKDPGSGVPMMGNPGSNQDGEYRIFGVAPGKYILMVQCGHPAFQARPFSAGPDPPPSKSYAAQFYPLAMDAKSAQVVELTAGNEKSGIDFQMAPVTVTRIRGIISPTGADWHAGGQLIMQLNPIGERGMNFGMGMGVSPNVEKGTFEFPPVVPGSYMLVAFSQGDEDKRVGAWLRIEVGEKPMEVTLELKHAFEVTGKVEIENGNGPNKLLPGQINVQLADQFFLPGSQTQVADDGTFTIKGVLPAPWRLQMNAPSGFIKAAWLGGVDVTNAPLDLSGGAAAPLRIVVSMNTATIRGSAPAGAAVAAQRLDAETHFAGNHMTTADQNGQYTLGGLPPGRYRVVAVELPGPMPDDAGQEVTVREGETVMADLKTP